MDALRLTGYGFFLRAAILANMTCFVPPFLGAALLVVLLAIIPVDAASAQDCISADISLATQLSVDNFQQDHGPCEVVVGDLTVVGDDIRNLNGLSRLTAVNGHLFISDNPILASLNGLNSLIQIGKDFLLQANNALGNFGGLSSLQSVGGNFYIFRNDALANLHGLESLSFVGNRLWIQGNPQLTDVDALRSFKNLGGSLRLYANDRLINLDGFTGLERIQTALEIIDNAALTNLDGFSNLHTVEGWMLIEFNDALVSINGLSSLTNIESLSIRQNDLLSNLDGLDALTRVGGLSVTWNQSLSNCLGIIKLIDPIDDGEQGHEHSLPYAPDVGAYLTLNNNLPGCNSVNEVLSTAQIRIINAGFNDAWFNFETNGQGFLITVFPEIKQFFLAWFTYDIERPPEEITAILGDPGHRWLTAQGGYEENIAGLDMQVTRGGVFDSAQPSPITEQGGEIMVEFDTCNSGVVSYDIPSLDRQGVVPIQRIVLDNVSTCYLLGKQAEAATALESN